MPVFEPVTPTVALPEQPPETPWPTTGWPEARSESPARSTLLNDAFADGANIDESGPMGQSLAFVAVHNGVLVDERHGPTSSPDDALISWSIAKSVTHALVGIAVQDGLLTLGDRAPVPEWDDPADPRHRITIDHLLRMVPGTEFVEDYVDDEVSHCLEMLFGAGQHDMAHFVASLPAIAEPNTVFNYSSGTTNLLTRILADLLDEDFEPWARARLFDPIGMTARLTFDTRGTWVGSSYLHATARDFAKFGLLYLRDGMWDGERLLPEGWVDHARTLQATDDEGAGYGAHWWLWKPNESAFHASGYETQRILVDPARDLVLVRLGKTPQAKAPAVDAWLEQVRQTFPMR